MVIVAKYLELRNDNNNVVIDDQFPLPCLIYRQKLVTDYKPTIASNIAFYYWYTYFGVGKQIKIESGVDELYSLGFNLPFSQENVKRINDSLLVFYRTDSGKPVGAYASISYNTKTGISTLMFQLVANELGVEGEIAVYCTDPTILFPRDFGGHFKDENGNVVFEFMRGALQVVGAMYGGVNTYNNPAATYNFTIPSELDRSNVFISYRSGLPFHTAYKISSGGVKQYAVSYAPVLTYTDSNLRVDLVRQGSLGGSNNVFSYGGYFENIAYIVQPEGLYI